MAYLDPAAGRAREAGASGGSASAVFTNAGAPSNGTSGTLAGVAPPGSLLVDTTNKNLYQNTNTLASPTWTQREGAGGVATADLADGSVTFAKAKVFISAEQTGTGSSQNVAHGLAAAPTGVLVTPTEHPGTPDTGAFDVAEGTHTSTNVVVTVTANVKFKVLAWV